MNLTIVLVLPHVNLVLQIPITMTKEETRVASIVPWVGRPKTAVLNVNRVKLVLLAMPLVKRVKIAMLVNTVKHAARRSSFTT